MVCCWCHLKSEKEGGGRWGTAKMQISTIEREWFPRGRISCSTKNERNLWCVTCLWMTAGLSGWWEEVRMNFKKIVSFSLIRLSGIIKFSGGSLICHREFSQNWEMRTGRTGANDFPDRLSDWLYGLQVPTCDQRRIRKHIDWREKTRGRVARSLTRTTHIHKLGERRRRDGSVAREESSDGRRMASRDNSMIPMSTTTSNHFTFPSLAFWLFLLSLSSLIPSIAMWVSLTAVYRDHDRESNECQSHLFRGKEESLRQKEKKILDDIIGNVDYDPRIRPSGSNATESDGKRLYLALHFIFPDTRIMQLLRKKALNR